MADGVRARRRRAGAADADTRGRILDAAQRLFTVRGYADAEAARHDLTHRKIYAAFDPSSVSLYYAGANGPSVTQLVTGVFGGVAAGRPLSSVDVLPVLTGRQPRSVDLLYRLRPGAGGLPVNARSTGSRTSTTTAWRAA